jgi:hypothetical protein
MKDVSVGGTSYRIAAVERDGQWTAYAQHADSGDRFGIECGGATHGDALNWLERWLVWQSEHTAALQALQGAERSYHRITAGNAFTNLGEGPAVGELLRRSLEEVDSARVRLDNVRMRKPENT